MSIYVTLIGTIAGICLGYALLYLFVGLRRSRDRRLNLLFALFAFGYAGTLLLGIAYRSQTTADAYLAITRWDTIFLWMAFVGLNWYVAEYTGVHNRSYLWSITTLFTVALTAAAANPNFVYEQQPTLILLQLPWREEIPTLAGKENIWGSVLILSQLATLVFILIAGLMQWRRGERNAALTLLGGMSWFIVALGYELGAQAGFWNYIPLAETGFVVIAIAWSLRMANMLIKTEAALAQHQGDLEQRVENRTSELKAANQQLLTQERVSAATEERRRLASDLHDSVTQTLYSVSLVAAALPRLIDRSVADARQSAAHLRNMTLGALAEMRTLLYELRPEAFETSKLATLLQQAADVFTGQTNLPVDVTIAADPQVATETKRTLYRITQEALNNAAKHADASSVTIDLATFDDSFVLTIQDDGRGFAAATQSGEGFGLAIMRERAERSQINLAIAAIPDQGTTVTATWPRETMNE